MSARNNFNGWTSHANHFDLFWGEKISFKPGDFTWVFWVINLGHGYKMPIYQLLKETQKPLTSDVAPAEKDKEVFKVNGKYLSKFIGHKERGGVCFWLHVSHMRRSGGIDMVGRKHLRQKQKKKAGSDYWEIKTSLWSLSTQRNVMENSATHYQM